MTTITLKLQFPKVYFPIFLNILLNGIVNRRIEVPDEFSKILSQIIDNLYGLLFREITTNDNNSKQHEGVEITKSCNSLDVVICLTIEQGYALTLIEAIKSGFWVNASSMIELTEKSIDKLLKLHNEIKSKYNYL